MAWLRSFFGLRPKGSIGEGVQHTIQTEQHKTIDLIEQHMETVTSRAGNSQHMVVKRSDSEFIGLPSRHAYVVVVIDTSPKAKEKGLGFAKLDGGRVIIQVSINREHVHEVAEESATGVGNTVKKFDPRYVYVQYLDKHERFSIENEISVCTDFLSHSLQNYVQVVRVEN